MQDEFHKLHHSHWGVVSTSDSPSLLDLTAICLAETVLDALFGMKTISSHSHCLLCELEIRL